MRIVVSSPPKMGNKWLKCQLAHVYGLAWRMGDDTPDTNPTKFEEWVAEGNFEDGTIFHQHCRFTPQLCDVVDAVPAHHVTVVRDPYDAFVSMFYWLSTRSGQDLKKGKQRPKVRPKDVLIDKSLGDPEVLDFLRGKYGDYIRKADDWTSSGRAVVARYENMIADPVAELKRVTDQIEPVDMATIEAAVEACTAENMRKMSEKMSTHVRSARVGDSREKLTEAHYAIFRERYAGLIEKLGYQVR